MINPSEKKPAYPTLASQMDYEEYSLFKVLLKGMVMEYRLKPTWINAFFQQCQTRYYPYEKYRAEWTFIVMVYHLLTDHEGCLGEYGEVNTWKWAGSIEDIWAKYRDERDYRELVLLMLTTALDGHKDIARMAYQRIVDRHISHDRKVEVAAVLYDAICETEGGKQEKKPKRQPVTTIFERLDDAEVWADSELGQWKALASDMCYFLADLHIEEEMGCLDPNDPEGTEVRQPALSYNQPLTTEELQGQLSSILEAYSRLLNQ